MGLKEKRIGDAIKHADEITRRLDIVANNVRRGSQPLYIALEIEGSLQKIRDAHAQAQKIVEENTKRP